MTDASSPPDTLYAEMGLVRIVEMDPAGRAMLEYRATPAQSHSGGVVQGGFVTGWIDAAMAHAVMAMPGLDAVPMTLEIKVSFFAPTRPGLVIAEAWVVQAGRRTVFVEGALKDSAGVLLAKASSTIALASRAKVESASKAAVG
ncbi:PaaI family thioesterase [Chakrabartia godavariana]|nr:PaaI family thioesterase [Chakrabartia godavariana]